MGKRIWQRQGHFKEFAMANLRTKFDTTNLRGKHLNSLSLFILSALHALFIKKFDLVHIHNTDAGFIIPLLRLKYNVIGTSHGYPYRRQKWSAIAKFFLRISELIFIHFSNLITCVSNTISRELTNRYKKKIYFIPNGIDIPSHIKDDSMFNKYELWNRSYMCFAAGRIDPTKGCHILLKAFIELNKDIDLVVIGDFSHKKDYSKELFQMADERVRFVPFIEKKETLFGIVKNSKIFVFPSTFEAMSIMLLEVAALGTPVICSDIPENVDVLKNRAIYFKSGDSDDLRLKIGYCLDHYEEILAISDQTKDWVVKQYNWRIISEEYKKVYSLLL
jgi:glycosyltransferase involved in cell wall biosynthesis